MPRPIRRVTLKDISKETGYSVNTVSHAMRGLSDISEETSEKIRETARRMGYAPNQLASALRSGRTRVIALILGSMSNPFYGIMADTIQDAAQEKGYHLMIMCSREREDLELKLAEQAIARRVDGILLFPTAGSAQTVDLIKAAGIPLVLLSRYVQPDQADCVVVDEAEGACLATLHLIEAGKRRLAYVASSSVVFSSEQRIRGFLRACDEAGIPEEDRRICVTSDSAEGYSVSGSEDQLISEETLLSLKQDGFDGLFIFCDVQAWHALNRMQHSRHIQPSDFAVVSFDNIEGALAFPIPLCSISCDYPQMARESIALLRKRIHGDKAPFKTVVLPVSLVCRGSCGRAKHQ